MPEAVFAERFERSQARSFHVPTRVAAALTAGSRTPRKRALAAEHTLCHTGFITAIESYTERVHLRVLVHLLRVALLGLGVLARVALQSAIHGVVVYGATGWQPLRQAPCWHDSSLFGSKPAAHVLHVYFDVTLNPWLAHESSLANPPWSAVRVAIFVMLCFSHEISACDFPTSISSTKNLFK